jgi:RNA polymerase sigma factor (sigma-70 family)
VRSLSSSEILEGIRNNDTKVLQNIYLTYFNKVRSFVLRNSGSEEDASDLFQEAIVIIFERVRGGYFEISCSFTSYFFSLSKYLWIKHLSIKKQTEDITISLDDLSNEEALIDLDTDIAGFLENTESRRFLQKHFSQLSERCQELIRLFFQKVPIATISQSLGVSEKFVKKKKFECKEKLMNRLKNDPLYYEYFKDD